MDIKEAASLLLQMHRNLSELERRKEETICELKQQIKQAVDAETSLRNRIEEHAFARGDKVCDERIVVVGGEAWMLRRNTCYGGIEWCAVPLGLVITDVE